MGHSGDRPQRSALRNQSQLRQPLRTPRYAYSDRPQTHKRQISIQYFRATGYDRDRRRKREQILRLLNQLDSTAAGAVPRQPQAAPRFTPGDIVPESSVERQSRFAAAGARRSPG